MAGVAGGGLAGVAGWVGPLGPSVCGAGVAGVWLVGVCVAGGGRCGWRCVFCDILSLIGWYVAKYDRWFGLR